MHVVHGWIDASLWVAAAIMLGSFVALAWCADYFVQGSVGLAQRWRIPKLVIGLVLVSLATTAPELSVSLVSALKGKPEIALGNAIGSGICNGGLALGLAGLFTVSAIALHPRILKTSGLFLFAAHLLLLFFVVFDGTLSRGEGGVLVALLMSYLLVLGHQYRSGRFREMADHEAVLSAVDTMSWGRIISFFVFGLGGMVLASDLIVTSASSIARTLAISDTIIAMTLVALGTSIPEVATCVVAARKGEGALAVGNILGANILNICWVAGAAALAHPLTLPRQEIAFMFPAMMAVVTVMLVLLRHNYSLTRTKGMVLLTLYLVYLAAFYVISLR